MGYEIDFLPVSENSKSGDAICLRYGNLFGKRSEQTVVVIDCGTQESGEKMIDHINRFYNTDKIDIMINTHPHADHCSGLLDVINKLTVSELWMHTPWEHKEYFEIFDDGRVTEKSLKERIISSCQSSYNVWELAKEKGIEIKEPFSNNKINSDFIILSPSKQFYIDQFKNFEKMPNYKNTTRTFSESVGEFIYKIIEKWNIETLKDPTENDKDYKNDSGTILLLNIESKLLLFTGDAGVEALTEANKFAKDRGYNLKNTSLFQVPHHGSKHNLGPTILNEVIGPIVLKDETKKSSAIISASKNDKKHPSRKVTNAINRRGRKVYTTENNSILHLNNAPDRDGWTSAQMIPFHNEVEED